MVALLILLMQRVICFSVYLNQQAGKTSADEVVIKIMSERRQLNDNAADKDDDIR